MNPQYAALPAIFAHLCGSERGVSDIARELAVIILLQPAASIKYSVLSA